MFWFSVSLGCFYKCCHLFKMAYSKSWVAKEAATTNHTSYRVRPQWGFGHAGHELKWWFIGDQVDMGIKREMWQNQRKENLSSSWWLGKGSIFDAGVLGVGKGDEMKELSKLQQAIYKNIRTKWLQRWILINIGDVRID